jgi:hypothetical protein
MDGVEQSDRIRGLVRLKRADQMKSDIGPLLCESGPFGLRFLDPVLAEDPLARLQQWVDRLGRMSLGDGNQCDVGGGTAGERRRLGDRAAHLLQPFGRRYHVRPIGSAMAFWEV